MPVNDELEKRMKEFYEQIPKIKLMRRTPVICRIDGRSFHTFTKGFKRPFDEILIKSMQDTMKYLCQNVSGCVAGYHQSDEISLVLIDYQKYTSGAFFDYEVQKMCSVIASMATMAFNKFFSYNVDIKFYEEFHERGIDQGGTFSEFNELETEYKAYYNKANKAMFDARVFNIPKEEVTNYLYWRQLDTARNSIQMVGQANFTHKELHGKSCNMIQDMLMTQKGIDWNDLPTYQKRGSCCIRNKMVSEPWGNKMMTNEVEEGQWFIDKNIPIFKGEDRKYIDDLIYVGEGL